jgi:peptidoglycan/xylan/chitin deacetylase (PgdA/CDA1 family)
LPALVAVVLTLTAVYVVWRLRYGVPSNRYPAVLCFHKISSRFCWEGTWTTPNRFFEYVDRLRRLGYRFVGMEDYLDSIATRRRGADREVVITFDDGYRELYDVVLPGLESRGIPFHVFLVTDYVGGENEWDLSLGRRAFRHLDWPQIVDMDSRGVTFGSHGASHRDLTRMSASEARAEMERSKAVIEQRLGRPARTVSYPFGRYSDRVKASARDAGFEAAFSLYPAHHNAHFDRYAIRRNGVYIIDPVALIASKWEPGPLLWVEEMKCRAINAFAVLTPLLKRRAASGSKQVRDR